VSSHILTAIRIEITGRKKSLENGLFLFGFCLGKSARPADTTLAIERNLKDFLKDGTQKKNETR
jgi:hypothetical protein